jgi:hypothetical protein
MFASTTSETIVLADALQKSSQHSFGASVLPGIE